MNTDGGRQYIRRARPCCRMSIKIMNLVPDRHFIIHEFSHHE